jgi:copper chaperone CopZ
MQRSTDDLSKVRTTTLAIGGMSCGACVRHVSRALEGRRGVVHAEVDLAKNEATVEHVPAVTDDDALVAAVRDAGYSARVTGARVDVELAPTANAPFVSCGCGCRRVERSGDPAT